MARTTYLRRRRGDDSGFTLIELLVVIAILGILAGIVVFATRGAGDKGAEAAAKTDARAIRTAQEAYCNANGEYATGQELADAGFLADPPEYHNVVLNNSGPCTGGDGNPTNSGFVLTCTAESPTCEADSGTIALGGTLIINNGANPPAASLNPAISSEGGLHSNSEDMFNGLLRYEPDGTIGGDLAQSFTIDNNVPAASNPNCASAACDPTTTVATFVLREGVKFHNGATLTPADVEFSFSRAILAAHGRTRAINPALGVTGSQLSTVVPAEAIQTLPPTPGNGGTVILNMRQVFAPLRYTLNVTEAPIISEAAYGPCWTNGTLFSITPPDACPANTAPVGTGPFKFQSLNSTGITTVKNPEYFRFDANGIRLPYLDAVFKKVVSGNAANALLTGAVDVASISANDRPLFNNNSNFVLTSTPRGSGGGNCITTIAFNLTLKGSGTTAPAPPGGTAAIGLSPAQGGYPTNSPYFGQNKPGTYENALPHPILGDARVREAIFKSLDRQKFWTDIAFGAGRVADAPVHSIFQPNGAYQGAQPLPTFDRTAAGNLLTAAGWGDTSNPDGFRRSQGHPSLPDGTKLALEYLASTGNETFATEVKAQLATVGIDVTPVHGSNTSFVAPKIFNARSFDMAQISYCNNDEPQFGVRRQYHTDQLIQTNAFTNASGYKSPAMDALWLAASKAPTTAEYQARFLEIQRMALGFDINGNPLPAGPERDQRIPMVQMLESAGTRGYRATCSGFNNNNTGLYMEAAYCAAP